MARGQEKDFTRGWSIMLFGGTVVLRAFLGAFPSSGERAHLCHTTKACSFNTRTRLTLCSLARQEGIGAANNNIHFLSPMDYFLPLPFTENSSLLIHLTKSTWHAYWKRNFQGSTEANDWLYNGLSAPLTVKAQQISDNNLLGVIWEIYILL